LDARKVRKPTFIELDKADNPAAITSAAERSANLEIGLTFNIGRIDRWSAHISAEPVRLD